MEFGVTFFLVSTVRIGARPGWMEQRLKRGKALRRAAETHPDGRRNRSCFSSFKCPAKNPSHPASPSTTHISSGILPKSKNIKSPQLNTHFPGTHYFKKQQFIKFDGATYLTSGRALQNKRILLSFFMYLIAL